MKKEIDKFLNKKMSRKKFLALFGGSILAVPFLSKRVLADLWFRKTDGTMVNFDKLDNYGNAVLITPSDDLQVKYDWLKSSDRDAEMGALSSTNRRTLILTPGTYTLSAILTLDIDYVDLTGLGSAIITNNGQVLSVVANCVIKGLQTVDLSDENLPINYTYDSQYPLWVDSYDVGSNFYVPFEACDGWTITHNGTRKDSGLVGFHAGGFGKIAQSPINLIKSWPIEGEGVFICGSDYKLYWVSDTNLPDSSQSFVERSPGGAAVGSTSSLTRSLIDCGNIVGKGRVILYCTYDETGNKKIYYTIDFGVNWISLFSGDCPTIKHFHGGVFVSGYGDNDGRLYVFTGDGDEASAILICDDVGDLIDNPETWYTRWGLDSRADWSGEPQSGAEPDSAYVLGYGSQKWRTIELVYDGNRYAYWASDSASDGMGIYRLDVNNHNVTTIRQPCGDVGDGWIGMATSDGKVLISTISKYWTNGTPVDGYDEYVRLYMVSDDKTSVHLVKKWRRVDYGDTPSGLAYIHRMWEQDGYILINGTRISQNPAPVGRIIDSGSLYNHQYPETGLGRALTDVPLPFNFLRNGRAEQTEKYVRTDEKFTGSGLNDLTPAGTYTGTSNSIKYTIEIDANGTPDTFKWLKDDVEQATGVAITGAAQTLDNGVTITFNATTGHTLTDNWKFYAGIKPLYWNVDTFDPLTYMAYETTEVQTGMICSTKITVASNASAYQRILFNHGLSSSDKMFAAIRGRYVTVAFDVKIASGSDDLAPLIYFSTSLPLTGNNCTNGEYIRTGVPADGEWYTLYGSFFIPPSATGLTLGFYPCYGSGKSGTIYVSDVRMCLGTKIPNKRPVDVESFGVM